MGRDEVLHANFLAHVLTSGYKAEQLMFLDETAKDERSLRRCCRGLDWVPAPHPC